MNKRAFGMEGQQEAERFLKSLGYKILVRNFQVRAGEIDLIAADGAYIVFVEVKYRRGTGHGLPRESVGVGKQRRIIQTALHYIADCELVDQDFRFDVVEVLAYGQRVVVNHIENAFGVS
ncbi:MAG: YraN family protein [Defluviitaleaceae bacterium]|jgi:putative endonuclease|nr:YraN family protein [Defluviitaleaceae bacterium]